MSSVRLAAARALLAVEAGRGTLGSIVDELRIPGAEARDLALLNELVTGVLRWRNALDAIVASAARRSIRTIDPPVLAVLRLGAYQFRYLDRIPDHAVVHESVQIMRTLGVTSASSFVNAALRSMIRRGAAISLPARPVAGNRDAEVNYLSVTLSHPAWLVRRWIERIGFEAAEQWCRFNNSVPDVTVRSLDGTPVESLMAELHGAGIAATPAPYAADAILLPPGELGRLPSELRAAIWIQDEGAQLVAQFAAVRPGERVLDLCASPGGKSLVFADALGSNDTPRGAGLVSSDHRARRVVLLRDTLRRAGLRIPVVRLDGTAPLPFSASFDCVVVDAPCSGLGTIRREPDLKWARTADELPALAATQRQILAAAADVVRPGGRLVYATCSSEPDENADVVEAFLREDERFTRVRGTSNRGVSGDLIDDHGQLHTRPDRHGLEVFFGAVLVRREGA